MQQILFKSSVFFILWIALSMTAMGNSAPQQSPWVVYYSNDLAPEAFDAYQLIVLDSEYHPLISPLVEKGKTVLAYISLGEVESHRPWYKDLKTEGIVLMENKNWPGSYFVDIRGTSWTQRVIEQIIPAILRKGFSGIFLDTLDNPAELERIDAEKYLGMTKAAIALVRTIRRHYPGIKIMLNRGYEILPHVGDAIDMALGESIYTDYNFKTQTYSKVDENTYKSQVKILRQAAANFPKLDIYTLDYWDPKDLQGIAEIYATQRESGFMPYVSTIELNQIIPEP